MSCLLGFPKMVEVVPEGNCGTAEVEHFVIDKAGADLHNLRCTFNPLGGLGMVGEGRFCRLLINGGVAMSDTRMERLTNHEAVEHSHGSVLLVGLGLGMVAHAVAVKQGVTSVTVIEENSDVVELIASSLPGRVRVVAGDIFDYEPDRKYDTIYFDIWSTICIDNLPEIAKLHQRGKYWLDRSNGTPWMGSWMQDHLRYMRRSGRCA